jgi:hypothetical protein
MIANTEILVSTLVSELDAEGFTIGPVGVLEYEPAPYLRALSAVGILAGLSSAGILSPENSTGSS